MHWCAPTHVCCRHLPRIERKTKTVSMFYISSLTQEQKNKCNKKENSREHVVLYPKNDKNERRERARRKKRQTEPRFEPRSFSQCTCARTHTNKNDGKNQQ